MLINLPPTCCCGGRHHFSNNNSDDKANDADLGEESVSDDADDANNANGEDNLFVTQPPSDNDNDHDHNDDEDDKEDEDDDNSYNSYNQGDIAIYNSNNHLIIDKYHPYNEVDKEDDNDEDSNINKDNDNNNDGKDADLNTHEDEDGKDADLNTHEDEDKDKDVLANSDKIYSASMVSYCNLNQVELVRQLEDADEDDHSSLSSIEEDHSDHSSISSIDFDHFDFAPILADLELIRQNGYMRNPRTGSYHSVNSSWQFTESQIRAAVRNFPDSFLREYFVGGTFPNFH